MEKQRLIRLSEVCRRVGLAKSRVYTLIREGEFPAMVKLGSKASGWVEGEIDAWIAARIEARDGQRKAA